MSDFSLEFHPWEDGFSQGYYLAAVECRAQTQALQAGAVQEYADPGMQRTVLPFPIQNDEAT